MNRYHRRPVLTLFVSFVLILAYAQAASAAPSAQRGAKKSKGDYNNPQCDITVTGTGSSPADVSAVNIAVNGVLPDDATVCLEGDFDFGAADFVGINPLANVDALRLTGINGATIRGGMQPLRFPVLTTTPSPLGSLTIDHIRFVEPAFTAISIFQGNELIQISDNIVDGVTSISAFGITLREGIVVTSVALDIDGKVIIQDNWVNGGEYDPVADEAGVYYGIGVFGDFAPNSGRFNAEVAISGNTVINWSVAGIGPIGLNGDTFIEHNHVEPGAFASIPLPPLTCAANGIVLTQTTDAVLRRNTIDMVPAFTGSGELAGCTSGILLSDSSDNSVRNNHVRGLGWYAVFVTGGAGASQDNAFQGNHWNKLSPIGAHVYLDAETMGNSFKGNVGTVIDDGMDNKFTGP